MTREELSVKVGDIVKYVEPADKQKAIDEMNWDTSDDLFVGRIGRIVEVDNGDIELPYCVSFHTIEGDPDWLVKDDKNVKWWTIADSIKPAKKWEKKKYLREKGSRVAR